MRKTILRSPKTGLLLFLFLFVFYGALHAGTEGQSISWAMLVFGLMGGLALFLYGMELMSEGMTKTAGNKMRSILAILTRNRVIALFCGAFVTMVIQSSSATTVMLVSFVQAGLMSFTQTMGVILGAGIGTTITAQMIAFKLTDYALLMIAIGFLIRLIGKTQATRNIGEAILGFGILFFGMKMMSDAMKPLRTYTAFIDLLRGLENPVMGILVGAVFTALIQSSSAFTGILIVLAQQNLITLEAGIPMVLGANIGTCVTAGLASMGGSREAKRVALAHVIFRIAGVLLFMWWIPTFADLVRTLAESFGSGPARQIANAHTIFNVSLALIFLPFTQLFAALVVKLLPDKESDKQLEIVTKYLDEGSILNPALAIDLARSEVSRMARLLWRMLDAVIIPFETKELQQDKFFPKLSLMEGIDMRERKLDFLEEKIRQFLIKVSRNELLEDQSREIFSLISIVTDIETIGDLIHRNIVPLIQKKHDLEQDFSDEGKEELMIYHKKVCKQIGLLEEAFAEINLDKAKLIMDKERKYLDLELQYMAKHLQRLVQENHSANETHEVHTELMEQMKQIIVYTSNIAKTFFSAKSTLI